MTEKEKLGNIEIIARYLHEQILSGSADEHFYPIYKAQTSNVDTEYRLIVESMYSWAYKALKEVEK